MIATTNRCRRNCLCVVGLLKHRHAHPRHARLLHRIFFTSM